MHLSKLYRSLLILTFFAWPPPGFADEFSSGLEALTGLSVGSPSERLWDWHSPNNLKNYERFTLQLETGFSDVLRRHATDGSSLKAFSAGLGAGAVIPWRLGTTAFHAEGRGQEFSITDSRKYVTIKSAPRLGNMVMAHTTTRGASQLGFAVVRSTYSFSDELLVDRFPHSSDNANLNRFLLDLLPKSIGNRVGYDGIGDRYALIFDGSRTWQDWTGGGTITWKRHISELTTEHYNTTGRLLSGLKVGFGDYDASGWDFGTNLEWRPDNMRSARLFVSWATSDGIFTLNQLNTPFDDSGTLLDTQTWLKDTLAVDRKLIGLKSRFAVGDRWTFDFSASYSVSQIDINGLVQSPVLGTITFGRRIVHRLDNILLVGKVRAWQTGVHLSKGGVNEWAPSLGLGAFGLSGTTSIDLDRDLYYYGSNTTKPFHTEFGYSSGVFAYGDIGIKRRITHQIILTYEARQYIQIGGHWTQNGNRTESGPVAGGNSSGGSTHRVTIIMEL